MSKYKGLRYRGASAFYTENDEEGSKDISELWHETDRELRRAIELYSAITDTVNGQEQVTFIDMIIKLTICRAYANNQNVKKITA